MHDKGAQWVSEMRLTMEHRFWQVPSRENAFEGMIEGRPTEEQRRQAYEKVDRERAEWKPADEAWQQLRQLQEFVGQSVWIQFWNPIMFMLEDEGPFPLKADCRGFAVVHEDGFLQPYLVLENVSEVLTPDGSSSLGYLKSIPGITGKCAPVAELYEIGTLDRSGLLPRDRRHLQNRVTPRGELIDTAARGNLMGNRGCLHNELQQIVRHHHGKRWISCRLSFKGVKRKIMAPGKYTELFFLDEATALAAGHRPCAECSRHRYREFVEAWAKGNPGVFGSDGLNANTVDAHLHSERLDEQGNKRMFTEELDSLPDGTFVMWPAAQPEHAVLVLGDALLVWKPDAYALMARARPKGVNVSVITPRSIVNALSAGYRPEALPPRPDLIISEQDESFEDFAKEFPHVTRSEWADTRFMMYAPDVRSLVVGGDDENPVPEAVRNGGRQVQEEAPKSGAGNSLSMHALEKLGRKSLSPNFFMRDFLYSESASLAGIPNYPDYPDVAVENGRKLCELLLEPLQEVFGRIEIRSAYRSSAVNEFCNKKNWGCASNLRNFGRHIWDVPGDDVGDGAMACIVIPAIAGLYKKDESVWKQLGWYIHDRLPYSELEFFASLCAFNIGWAARPIKCIRRSTGTLRLLTEPGAHGHDKDHSDQYAGLLRVLNLK